MTYELFSDEYFMDLALKQAQKAFEEGEVPIGAVIVQNNQILAKAYNQTETLQDPTAHAEILAITSANQKIGSKYLPEATLYVTVEPCVMCSGAIMWSKISRLVYGASEPKFGFNRIEVELKEKNLSLCHPKLKIEGGILSDKSAELMKNFFKNKRK